MKTNNTTMEERFDENVVFLECPCGSKDCNVRMYFPDDIKSFIRTEISLAVKQAVLALLNSSKI